MVAPWAKPEPLFTFEDPSSSIVRGMRAHIYVQERLSSHLQDSETASKLLDRFSFVTSSKRFSTIIAILCFVIEVVNTFDFELSLPLSDTSRFETLSF